MYTTFYRHNETIGHFCIRHQPAGNITNHCTEGNATLKKLHTMDTGPILDITEVSFFSIIDAPNNPPLKYWLDSGAAIIKAN